MSLLRSKPSKGSTPGPEGGSPLLQPQNRLATLQKYPESGGPPQMILELNNVDSLVQQLGTQSLVPPALDTLPTVFFAVLGHNRHHLRTLHTDWLIHYFENYSSVQQAPGSTRDIYRLLAPSPLENTPHQLKYVSNTSLEEFPANLTEGVYIWPKPYKVEERDSHTGKKQTFLCFVIYAHGNSVVDHYAASLASKLVVFQEEEGENFRTFLKVLHNGQLSPFTSYVPATGQTRLATGKKEPDVLEAGWESFSKVMKENKCISGKNDRVKKLPTLDSLRKHLMTLTNHFNDLPDNVTKLIVEAQQKRNALEEQGDRGESEVEGLSGDNMTDPLVTSFLNWVQDDLRFSLNPKIYQRLVETGPEGGKGLQLLQSVLSVYHLDLQNMFDNFVCFAGRLDEEKMGRLQSDARIREQSSWEKCEGAVPATVLSVVKRLEEDICKGLAKRVREENYKIIMYETKLAKTVKDSMLREYSKQMTRCLQLHKEGRISYKEADLEQVHHNLVNHCKGLMNHSMDFHGAGGKLNRVLLDYQQILEQEANNVWASFKASIKFAPGVTPISQNLPRGGKNTDLWECHRRMGRYMKDIENIITSGLLEPRQFKEVHEQKWLKHFGDATPAQREKWRDVEERLHTHLIYAWEQHQETFQKGREDANPPLVIYLTETHIRVLIRKSAQWYYVQMFRKNETAGPSDCIMMKQLEKAGAPLQYAFGDTAQSLARSRKLGEGEWLGTVFECIRLAKAHERNYQHARKMMTTILEECAKCARGILSKEGRNVTSLVLIVPSWFTVTDRALLRRAAAEVDFQGAVVLNESSLVAHQFLGTSASRQQGRESTLVVVVIARAEGVQVEIFQGQEPNRTLLVALAREERGREAGRQAPDGNYVRLLQTVYFRALRQLPETTTGVKECFILSTRQDWKPLLEEGLHVADKTLVLRKNVDMPNFVVTEVIRLDENLRTVRSSLIDYIQLPEGNPGSGAGSAEEEKPPPVPETDGVLSAQQERLLLKCEAVEKQVAAGNVRLRVLSKKILTEALEEARAAVESNQDVERNEREMDELIEEFNIQI